MVRCNNQRGSRRLLLAFIGYAAALASSAAAVERTPAEQRFALIVSEIQDADYRADRPQLAHLAEAAAQLRVPAHAKFQNYWIAFAWWRRAINGMNETPTPADLLTDLTKCEAAARRAFEIDPTFEDARGELSVCLAMQINLVPTERKTAAITATGAVVRDLAAARETTRNPRSLWLLAGFQAFGGDIKGSVTTLVRGLDLARIERESPATAPWVPRWAEAELFMSLAYTTSRPPLLDPPAARAYAHAALILSPRWHYVREILMPQIDALPKPSPSPSPSPR